MIQDNNIIPELKNKLKGKILIIGLGNVMRGDDGAGPELIRRLNSSKLSAINSELFLMDVGEVLENYLGKIVKYKPDTILLVDAVDFKVPPGSIKVIDIETIKNESFSTHNISLKLTLGYLKERTKADIFVLGIQPKNLGMNSRFSKPVKQAIEQIEKYLTKNLKKS